MTIPKSILNKTAKIFFTKKNNPICVVKDLLHKSIKGYTLFEDTNPYVSVEHNFDSLLFSPTHPARSLGFYKDEKYLLRTHMAAHLFGRIKLGYEKFLSCGDVYSKENKISRTSYPVSHQMDCFSIVNGEFPSTAMRNLMKSIMVYLFGKTTKYRFLEEELGSDVHFPYTIHASQIEVEFINKDTGEISWIKVMSGGVVHPEIMEKACKKNEQAFTFSIDLDHLAMKLFNIPDIRLIWSEDVRFSNQFESGRLSTYSAFAKYPVCYFRDIALWETSDFNINDMLFIIRDVSNDMVEEVYPLDFRSNNNLGKKSLSYRIKYRHVAKSLIDTDIVDAHNIIRDRLKRELNLQLWG